MLFNTLILELGDCTMSILPKTNTTIDFANMKLFCAPKASFNKSTLYFANLSDFDQYTDLPEINAIIYDDRPEKGNYDMDYFSQLAGGMIFSIKEEYEECFNAFETCFLNAYRMEEHLRTISSLVYENGSLQDIANEVAIMYDHPMNIVDNSFAVISSSTNYEFFSEDLARDNQSGHIPTPILEQLNIANRRKHDLGKRTIIIDHIGGEFHNYFTPIVFNGIALGYFSVFLRPDETMSAMERGYLSRVAEFLGIFIQRNDFSRENRGSYYASLLSTLLSENRQLHNIEEERFQIFGYKMKKYKYIVCADTTQDSPEDYFLGDLSSSIRKLLGNCIYAVQRNQSIFLASYDSVTDGIQQSLGALENVLLSTPFVRIGISSPYEILNESRGHYIEAKAAITAGIQYHSPDRVLLYDNFRVLHMVQTLGQTSDIRLFMLPQFYIIMDYDREKNSELLYTLFAYTKHVGDVAKTCDHLHIHRNTLYFRLGKIKELTHLDLDNSETMAMIVISFSIMKLQNEIDWEI